MTELISENAPSQRDGQLAVLVPSTVNRRRGPAAIQCGLSELQRISTDNSSATIETAANLLEQKLAEQLNTLIDTLSEEYQSNPGENPLEKVGGTNFLLAMYNQALAAATNELTAFVKNKCIEDGFQAKTLIFAGNHAFTRLRELMSRVITYANFRCKVKKRLHLNVFIARSIDEFSDLEKIIISIAKHSNISATHKYWTYIFNQITQFRRQLRLNLTSYIEAYSANQKELNLPLLSKEDFEKLTEQINKNPQPDYERYVCNTLTEEARNNVDIIPLSDIFENNPWRNYNIGLFKKSVIPLGLLPNKEVNSNYFFNFNEISKQNEQNTSIADQNVSLGTSTLDLLPQILASSTLTETSSENMQDPLPSEQNATVLSFPRPDTSFSHTIIPFTEKTGSSLAAPSLYLEQKVESFTPSELGEFDYINEEIEYENSPDQSSIQGEETGLESQFSIESEETDLAALYEIAAPSTEGEETDLDNLFETPAPSTQDEEIARENLPETPQPFIEEGLAPFPDPELGRAGLTRTGIDLTGHPPFNTSPPNDSGNQP